MNCEGGVHRKENKFAKNMSYQNRIGIKNFKQFKQYTSIEFKDLTFITGKNNSGKSTFIKALILILEYLKSDNHTIVNLKNSLFNLGIYERVKNFNSEENEILIELYFNDLLFSVQMYSTNLNDIVLDVKNLRIQAYGNSYFYDFENKIFIWSKFNKNDQGNGNSELIDDKKIFVDISEKKLSLINQEILLKVQQEKSISTTDIELLTTIEGVVNNKAELNAFISNNYISSSFFKKLNLFIEDFNITYFQSKNFKASSFHLIDDNFDALSKILKKYSDLGIDKHGISSSLFIQKWINKDNFNIGDTIKVVNHSNEAYELKVLQNEKYINSSDLGTGAIQCLAILIAIANIIHLGKKSNRIIFIEEPEQNLHPDFQSKLADLFFEVSDKYGIKIFTETHSEYIIRKTQLIGLQNKLFEDQTKNPFTVIYFDKENGPYEMKYNGNGSFDRDFGEGFYDVASDNLMEMFLLNN